MIIVSYYCINTKKYWLRAIYKGNELADPLLYLMSSQHGNKALGKMADLPGISTDYSLVLNFCKKVEYTL